MACFGEYWLEFQELSELTRPTVLTNMLEVMFVLSDVAMLGRLGRGHIAALAVGNAVFNFAWYFIEGFFTAQDTLSSIAFVQQDLRALRYWTYASLCCVLLLCVLATGMYVFAGTILERAFLISPHIASKAVLHVWLLAPSVWFLALFRVLQKYLSCQHVTKPVVHALLLGNAVNIGLNFLLIFVSGLGFAGCSLATTLARLCMLLYLFKRVKTMSGFVHMRVELRALVRHTPAETIMLQAETLEDVIYGAPATRTVGRARRKVAGILEHVGTSLNIPSLARRAKRWGQEFDNDDADLEMSSLLSSHNGKDGKHLNRKPVHVHKRNGRVVPISFDPDSAAGTAAAAAAGGTVGEERQDSYLDDIGMDDSNYARKYGVKSRKQQELEHKEKESHARTSAAGGKNNSDIEEESNGKEDEDNSDGDQDDSDDSEDSEDIEEARRTARGPKMLMLIRTLRFLVIGLPGGLMCGLETWVFCVVALLVQRIGSVPLAATFVGMMFIETVYLAIPFSLSVACTVRVSQLLASKRPERAAVCSAVSMIVGAVFVGLTGLLAYYLPSLVGYTFTTDKDVVSRVVQLAPYLAGYQAMWGLTGLCQGVLRAQGKQMEVVAFIFITMWIVGIPLGWWWGFYVRPTHGLYGYWGGLCVGMGLLTLILLIMVLSTDWHYESRAMVVRADQEKEGFAQPSSSNMWMTKGLGTAAGSTYSPLIDDALLPQVGRASIGSRAPGGFNVGPGTLDEVLDMQEQIEIELTTDAAAVNA